MPIETPQLSKLRMESLGSAAKLSSRQSDLGVHQFEVLTPALTVIAPPATIVLKPGVEQAQDALRKAAFRVAAVISVGLSHSVNHKSVISDTLTRSRKDYSPNYPRKSRGRRGSRRRCPRCNSNSRHSLFGEQCRTGLKIKNDALNHNSYF